MLHGHCNSTYIPVTYKLPSYFQYMYIYTSVCTYTCSIHTHVDVCIHGLLCCTDQPVSLQCLFTSHTSLLHGGLRMGYEITRFEDEVDEELMCSICGQVLEAPIQIRKCEHCFCESCINEWLKHRPVYPNDRNPVSPMEDLTQPPRILRNLLSRLKITCDKEEFGCTVNVSHHELGSIGSASR